jgi:hypothetical protein
MNRHQISINIHEHGNEIHPFPLYCKFINLIAPKRYVQRGNF